MLPKSAFYVIILNASAYSPNITYVEGSHQVATAYYIKSMLRVKPSAQYNFSLISLILFFFCCDQHIHSTYCLAVFDAKILQMPETSSLKHANCNSSMVSIDSNSYLACFRVIK